MLWWDNEVRKNQIKLPEPDNDEIVEACYRNTGNVPIPRKVSRKMSVPACPPQNPRPPPSRKVSCPAPSTALKRALEYLDQTEFCDPPPQLSLALLTAQSTICLHPKEEPRSRVTVSRAQVKEDKEKAVTREPDVKKELKRGSMRDKWGISLVHRMGEGGRLELGVSKVAMFSPAAKAGLKAGNTLVLVNDWKIEAMEHIQAALSILLAAGFSVQLAWLTTTDPLDSWQPLDVI